VRDGGRVRDEGTFPFSTCGEGLGMREHFPSPLAVHLWRRLSDEGTFPFSTCGEGLGMRDNLVFLITFAHQFLIINYQFV
jgi:hypothetical protein